MMPSDVSGVPLAAQHPAAHHQAFVIEDAGYKVRIYVEALREGTEFMYRMLDRFRV